VRSDRGGLSGLGVRGDAARTRIAARQRDAHSH
jgi:hypothetical protein